MLPIQRHFVSSYPRVTQDTQRAITSATRQVRQRWFSVCIFPLKQFIGLTGNRPQSAPACSFLRWRQPYGDIANLKLTARNIQLKT